jgi:bla regulator protein BlaR1
MAVPVAALNFVPTSPGTAGAASLASGDRQANPAAPYYVASRDEDSALSDAIGDVVSTSIAGALSVVHPHPESDHDKEADKDGDDWNGYGPKPGTVFGPKPGTIFGPQGPLGPRQRAAIDRAIEMKAVGVTEEYVAALRAASPKLRSLDAHEAVGLKAVGVTGAYVRELAAAGYAHLDADDLMEARALNIDGNYVRGLAASGYSRLALDQLVELRAMGVTGADIERLRRAGYRHLTVDQLVDMKAVGVDPHDIREAEHDDGHDDGS